MTQTTERVHEHETPSSAAQSQPPRRSLRTVLGWAAIATGLTAAVTLVLLTITSGNGPQRIEIERAPAEPPLVGVPRSADGAERYLANHSLTRPMGVPRSADGAERHLAAHSATRPMGVPQSADGAERYLANHSTTRPMGVPRSADGADRWLAVHE